MVRSKAALAPGTLDILVETVIKAAPFLRFAFVMEVARIEEIKQLDPAQLHEYCIGNSAVCKKELWLQLLEEVFPDIYQVVTTLTDRSYSGFMWPSLPRSKLNPLQNLYMQALLASQDPATLALVTAALNNESLDSIDDTKERIRSYYPVLSFVLANISNDWLRYLLDKDDPYLLYTSALSIAVRQGDTELIELLFSTLGIKSGEMISSALMEAVLEPQPEIVKFLLDLGTRLNIVNFDKILDLILERAVSLNDIQTVKVLLDDGRVNPTRVLRNALQGDNTAIVRLLLSDPRINPAMDLDTPLHFAASTGDTELVKFLLNDQRVNPYSLLITAAQNGDVKIVELLLAHPRVNPSYLHNVTLRRAVSHGHTEVVELLLADSRIDPSQVNNAPLISAAKKGYIDIVEFLLADPRVDPSYPNNAAVRAAMQNGHTDIVNLLISAP